MSQLHALQDPDPLNPSDVDQAYAEGFADGWTSTKPRSLSAPLALGLIAGAFLAGFIVHAALAAPRTAANAIPTAAEAVAEHAASGNPSQSFGAPRVWMPVEVLEAEASRAVPIPVGKVGAPTPSAAGISHLCCQRTTTPRPKPPKVTGATVRGSATWYDDHRKSGLYAAVHSWRWGDTPYRVIVRAGDRTVVVTVSDYCLCTGGGDRVIDLSNEAFSRLAPLSAGVVDVTVRGLR